MTFIYLTTFRENQKKSPRCVSVAHVLLSWRPGKFVLNCHESTTPTANAALSTLIQALRELPFKQDHIKIISDNHELVWDMQRVLTGEASEFISKRLWSEFINTLAENDISMGQIRVSENGIMLSSEKDMARQQITQTNWGISL